MSENGHDFVLIVVDKLGRRVIFILETNDLDAEEVAYLFNEHIFSERGVPEKLSSDRDPKCTYSYRKTLVKAKGTRRMTNSQRDPYKL